MTEYIPLILIAIIITPILSIGIYRQRKLINGSREEKIKEIRRGDTVVEVTHRNQKIKMTVSQKENWDQLSRAEKTFFLKNYGIQYKVKR